MLDFVRDLSYQVDFNHFDEDGRYLKGSVWHGTTRRFPRPGERVTLNDAEGNRCEANVYEVHGVIVLFDLDDSTWVSGVQTQTATYSDSSWHVSTT